eukprot:gene19357-biopygen763
MKLLIAFEVMIGCFQLVGEAPDLWCCLGVMGDEVKDNQRESRAQAILSWPPPLQHPYRMCTDNLQCPARHEVPNRKTYLELHKEMGILIQCLRQYGIQTPHIGMMDEEDRKKVSDRTALSRCPIAYSEVPSKQKSSLGCIITTHMKGFA